MPATSQPQATYDVPPPHEDGKGQSQEYTNSKKSALDRARIDMQVTILGNPAAAAEMILIVIGAKPGVDGAYRTKKVVHRLNRNGYETNIHAEAMGA